MLATRPSARIINNGPSWAALLEHFYKKRGLPLPRITELEEQVTPQPYRKLLAHSLDMTPTLENFYGGQVALQVISREVEPHTYSREVVLTLGSDEQPIEYGVIRIRLDRFKDRARARVLAEEAPLGNILQAEGIAHSSSPRAFFKVESDGHITNLLRLNGPCPLYGRRNVLLDGARHLLAEVIEILAPVRNHVDRSQ
jgi:chorismate-pyruvate lyase